jgi:hypothetical protein
LGRFRSGGRMTREIKFRAWNREKIQKVLERRANFPKVVEPKVVDDWKTYSKEKRNAE